MSDIDKLTVIDRDLVENIKSIILSSRKSLSQRVNQELIFTYWRIGKEIVDTEQKNNLDNQSSRQIILNLSKLLTKEIGKGFSRSNLFNMRKLYTEYSDVQSLTGHLTWTHFCELLIIEDKAKRSFYEKETVNSNWSIRELKRQIDSSLYERLLLSKGSKNKEKVLELARKGQEITNADDILKIRMFLNFLEFLRISQF
jgi:predicted nuclease of restriction endonuclease-like (RecB) superfamily